MNQMPSQILFSLGFYQPDLEKTIFPYLEVCLPMYMCYCACVCVFTQYAGKIYKRMRPHRHTHIHIYIFFLCNIYIFKHMYCLCKFELVCACKYIFLSKNMVRLNMVLDYYICMFFWVVLCESLINQWCLYCVKLNSLFISQRVSS